MTYPLPRKKCLLGFLFFRLGYTSKQARATYKRLKGLGYTTEAIMLKVLNDKFMALR